MDAPNELPGRPKEAEKLLKEARKRWTACAEADNEQRERIIAAKNFRAGGKRQWPDAVYQQRTGGESAIQGVPAMPARPCLTIDRLSQPVRQISNSIKTANFAIDVLPNGFGADTETAEIFKGYLRYVQNRARGESPVEWAADQAIEGGLGWLRILTKYCYDDLTGIPPEAVGDQELALDRIANNLTVYCDPWAVKPTRSDARFMFVTEDLSKDEFARRWPEADLQGLEDFAASGDCPKGWVETDAIRIAEYWRIENAPKETWIEVEPWGAWHAVTEVPKGFKGRQRVVHRPIVKGSKITATQELEAWEWVGSKIPLIPILGEEMNIDGKSYLRGIIEPGMDAQRMVNYTYSGAVEIFALGSKSQYVAADDQIADYKAIWETANTVNWAYLPYKPVVMGGTVLAPPQRDTSEAPIQAAAMLLQVSEEGIKATTGIYDSGLGGNSPRIQSGRAKQSEIQQSELGSSNYPDNVRRALIYAGELMVEIAPKITRPGQLLHILGVDDEPQQVIVGQPYVEQNGKAQPVQESEAAQYEKGMVKFYDFTKGKYAVTVAVSKSHATKREEGAAAIGELIPGLPPPMAAVAAPEYVENLSFPGAHKLAEMMRKTLPPELQEPKDGEEPIPPAAQQQMAQMQQMIEELKPLADKNQVELRKVELQQQGDNERVQFEKGLDGQRVQAELASKERIEQMKVDLELRKLEVELEIEMAKLGSGQAMARAKLEQEELHHHDDQTLRREELDTSTAQADLDRQAAQDQAAMSAAQSQSNA